MGKKKRILAGLATVTGAAVLLGAVQRLLQPKYMSDVVEGNLIASYYDTGKDHDADEITGGSDDMGSSSGGEGSFQDLLQQAIEMAVEDGSTSTSMLQRRLRVGYARAGRLIDEMEKRGIISQSEGSKPRKTIITREQYYEMMGNE